MLKKRHKNFFVSQPFSKAADPNGDRTRDHVLQGSKIGTSLWLSDWSESADVLPVNESRAETGLRLGVYGALGVSQGRQHEASILLKFIASWYPSNFMHPSNPGMIETSWFFFTVKKIVTIP